jgi:hypothetical protein
MGRFPIAIWRFVPAIVLAVASCDGGEPVALNERLFSIATSQSEGAGCYLYRLGSGNQVSAGGGATDGQLVVNQRLDGMAVVVSVTDGGRMIVERRYDEMFFQVGTVDEFTATPPGGGDGLRLRYWGKFHPDGEAGCTPLEQDGP